MDDLGTPTPPSDWIESAEKEMSKKTPEKEADTSSSEEEKQPSKDTSEDSSEEDSSEEDSPEEDSPEEDSPEEDLPSEGEESEDYTSEEEDPSYYFKKIERKINNATLEDVHPEIININSDEMLALSKCVRNKEGIVVDLLHQTMPFLTKYERAKILGLRAKQLDSGSKPFINITEQMINSYTIASEELQQKKIPFIIRRPLPNGASEYWKIEDLDLIDN